jgi:hypothetical protein
VHLEAEAEPPPSPGDPPPASGVVRSAIDASQHLYYAGTSMGELYAAFRRAAVGAACSTGLTSIRARLRLVSRTSKSTSTACGRPHCGKRRPRSRPSGCDTSSHVPLTEPRQARVPDPEENPDRPVRRRTPDPLVRLRYSAMRSASEWARRSPPRPHTGQRHVSAVEQGRGLAAPHTASAAGTNSVVCCRDLVEKALDPTRLLTPRVCECGRPASDPQARAAGR